jgi:hypothetical protein
MPPIKESSFVRNLLIGATKGGYWNSFHMALQLEDVVDCLKVVRPGYDFFSSIIAKATRERKMVHLMYLVCHGVLVESNQ